MAHLKTTMTKVAQIAEWSSDSTFEHLYATPWAVSSRLGDDKLFLARLLQLTLKEDAVKEKRYYNMFKFIWIEMC